MAKLNPVFSGIRVEEGINDAASVKGVALKTVILLAIAVVSGFLAISYGAVIYENIILYLGVLFGALICGIIGQTSPNAAKVCSIIYAVCEGILLGLVSFLFEAVIGGIVLSAVLVTATIFGVMLLLYSTNIIRVTSRFMKIVSGIGVALVLAMLFFFLSSIIAPNNIMIMAYYSSPGLMILVSGIILLYGAFMLAIDFEQVNAIVANGFDKKYEWMAALGLMVTIVWIYLEVLRLLAIIARYSRD